MTDGITLKEWMQGLTPGTPAYEEAAARFYDLREPLALSDADRRRRALAVELQAGIDSAAQATPAVKPPRRPYGAVEPKQRRYLPERTSR